MPKDNHSLMQLYLDGRKNNFYTFFYVKDDFTKKILNNEIDVTATCVRVPVRTGHSESINIIFHYSSFRFFNYFGRQD